MSFADRLRRVPPAGWVAILAAALILPGLGSFGFWDPWELGIADRARALSRSGHLFDVTVGARYGGEPPLDLFLSALGMNLFGTTELGARLFHALFALVAVFAVYWGGSGLFRRRAGALAAAALVTMPLFLLQARQLTSDMPLIAGLALAMAGLGRYAWPASGQRSLRDLAVGALGLVVGLLSGGALLGVALPCLALVGTIAAGWGLQAKAPAGEGGADAPSALSAPGTGRDVPAGKSFGAGLLSSGGLGKIALAAVALLGLVTLIFTLTSANVAGKYSLWLGGVPRGGTPAQMFEYLIKQLGFGLFPWSAVAVFALGRPLVRLGGGDEPDGGRLAFAQLYLLVFAAFAFALSTVFVLMTGDARFPALAVIALAIGAFLDEALEGERAEPVLGLLIGTGTLVIARDFFLGPEELVSVHLFGTKVKWPPTLGINYVFLAVGLLVGLGVYTGLATRGRALGRVAPRDLGASAGRWHRRLERLVVEAGRWGVQAAVATAILFAAFLAHGIVPLLSKHLSFKPVLESYARFAKPDEEIGKYRVEGHGTSFYSKRNLVEIPTQDRLVEFLRQPRRTFCLVSADDLAALDAAFKTAAVAYFVVDATSSRFLLLSNRLAQGERDENPLKTSVWMAPSPPVAVAVPGTNQTRYEWKGTPPWQPRVAAQAIFGDSIELVGADYPETVRRPGKIPLTLYFRVNTRPPAGYKIFVHFDTPNEPRVIGDHPPLGGAFPTAYWLPGEYVRDHHEVDLPLMTGTPAGTYTLLVGFWPGGEGKRLKITAGNNDGADRARIGTIEIR
jgi:hypothetical protein